jgi:hypothetical protein
MKNFDRTDATFFAVVVVLAALAILLYGGLAAFI